MHSSFSNECFVRTTDVHGSVALNISDARNTFWPFGTESPQSADGVEIMMGIEFSCSTTMLLPVPEHFGIYSIAFAPIDSRWRDDCSSRIYVFASLSNRQAPDVAGTRFIAYEINVETDRSNFISRTTPSRSRLHPPTLSLIRQTRPLLLPMAHPYLTESVTMIGRGGHGLLTSVNQKNSKIRYFAFSVERLFALDEDLRRREASLDVPKTKIESSPALEPLGPVHFGNDSIAPGTVALEPHSGAVAFTRDDPKSGFTKELVIQYYD